jgi:hypothetical protein
MASLSTAVTLGTSSAPSARLLRTVTGLSNPLNSQIRKLQKFVVTYNMAFLITFVAHLGLGLLIAITGNMAFAST